MGKEDVIPHSEFSVSGDYDGDISMRCLTDDCHWGWWSSENYEDLPSDPTLSYLNNLAAVHTRAPFEYTVKNKCPGSFHLGVKGNVPDISGMLIQRCGLCSVRFVEHP